MKYKIGDRVKIINYGHLIWEHQEGKEKPICYDLQPGYVGKKATVVGDRLTQNRESYGLDIDGIGKVSWFGLKQLKKAWSWKNLW